MVIDHFCEKRQEFFDFISEHFQVTFTEKSFKDPLLTVHALTTEGKIIAVLLIKKKAKELHRITFIRVAEEFKQKGYGKIILNIAMQDAYKYFKAPIKVLTRVKAHNIPSLHFFLSNGFKMAEFECKTVTEIINGNIVTQTKPAYLLTYDYGNEFRTDNLVKQD